MSQSDAPASAKEQADDPVEFGQEFNSAVDSMFEAYPKYIVFIV